MHPSAPAPVPFADPRVPLGRRIAELRHDRRMSQQVLAARAGVSRSYLASLELGRRNVGLVNLARLAAALDVPVAALFPPELFPGDGPEAPIDPDAATEPGPGDGRR